jgi:hypothetical protein
MPDYTSPKALEETRAKAKAVGGTWQSSYADYQVAVVRDADGRMVASCRSNLAVTEADRALALHIAHNHPARVLAMCDALTEIDHQASRALQCLYDDADHTTAEHVKMMADLMEADRENAEVNVGRLETERTARLALARQSHALGEKLASESATRLAAERERQEAWDEIGEWQDASGLENAHGDPSDLTPQNLRDWDWPGKLDAAERERDILREMLEHDLKTAWASAHAGWCSFSLMLSNADRLKRERDELRATLGEYGHCACDIPERTLKQRTDELEAENARLRSRLRELGEDDE